MASLRVLIIPMLILPALAQALPLDLAARSFTGTDKVVVIPLQFQDVKGVTPTLSFQNLFFAEGANERSVRDYFLETSSGEFTLGGTVVPQWLTSAKKMGQYGNSENFGRQPALDPLLPPVPVCAMAYEAARLADPFVDYSKHVGPDGRVNLVILHAGTPEDFTDVDPDIWSQAWVGDARLCADDGSSRDVTFDGVRVGGFMTDSEFSPLGTNAHELGHLLFWLPDLYFAPNVVQGWDLMASGSWDGDATANPQDPHAVIPRGANPSHMGAYLKSLMGWTTTQTVGPATGIYALEAAERATGLRTLRLPIATNACSNAWTMVDGNFQFGFGSRYFLVEYRDAEAGRYDRDSTQSGVLVWHVDECANGGNWWEMNSGAVQRVRVIPSGTSYAWAALREGATFSHLSTSSTTIAGQETGWFVDVIEVGDTATVRVGKATIDARIRTPGPASVAAGGVSQGLVSGAYVAQAGTRVTYEGPSVWSRETPARIDVSGGATIAARLVGAATHTLACTTAGASATCTVPATAPAGEYVLVVTASSGPAVRLLTRTVALA